MLDNLPTINAVLNLTSLVFLIGGRAAIKRGDRDLHRSLMLGAFGASAVFLVGYLTRMALTGTHRFPDAGWVKTVYLVILFSHMVLAALIVPLVFRLLFLAWKKRFDAHRRLARVTWPMWIYVSTTGVIVYLMLYHVAPRLTGA